MPIWGDRYSTGAQEDFGVYGLGFVIGFDGAELVREQLDRLKKLGLSGFLIALAVLFVFLLIQGWSFKKKAKVTESSYQERTGFNEDLQGFADYHHVFEDLQTERGAEQAGSGRAGARAARPAAGRRRGASPA